MEKNESEIIITNHRFIRFEDSVIGYDKDGRIICELGKDCRGYVKYAFMGFTINSFLLNFLNDKAIIHCSYGYQTVGNIKKLGKRIIGNPNHCDWYINCSIFKKSIEELGNLNIEELYKESLNSELKGFEYKIDIDLWHLCLKERWDAEDIAEFGRLRKLKYGDNRIENTSGIFYQIRKQHTKPTQKLVRSWKECVMKFHYEGFESLSTESNKNFQGIEAPFNPYHQDIIDCDIVKITGIRGIYRRYNHTYYLCSGECQGMWLIAKEAPDPFRDLFFEDRGSIDFMEKDGKFIDSDGKRKAYQIYKNKI